MVFSGSKTVSGLAGKLAIVGSKRSDELESPCGVASVNDRPRCLREVRDPVAMLYALPIGNGDDGQPIAGRLVWGMGLVPWSS